MEKYSACMDVLKVYLSLKQKISITLIKIFNFNNKYLFRYISISLI